MEDMHSFKELALVFMMLVTPSKLQFVSPEPTAMFDKVPAQGRYLKVYETQHKAESSGKCALMCSMEMTKTPPCQAFGYHPLNGTCDFYTAGDTAISVSELSVFLLQTTDKFFAISIGDKEFSIYLSSAVMNDYSGALTHCNTLGGHLLVLDSLDKYDAMKMIGTGTTNVYAYVDANDNDLEDTWIQTRDGSNIELALLIWANGEPNNFQLNENCAAINLGLKALIDVPCSFQIPVLCENN